MNIKWKVALLTLLGFSTAGCCTTKKASKAETSEPNNIESEIDDPRIMLMYGVPFPDGEVARPIDPEQAKEEIKALKREAEKGAEQEASAAENEGVPFEDGSIVKPISEEEAKKLIEELKQGNEEAAQQAAQENQ